MADLEKLTVLLEAQTKQFDSAMKRVARLTDDTANKATRSLSRLDKALARSGTAVTGFFKSFALGAIGGLGIERLASSIGQAVKQMADLADEARRAGMSAEDIQAIGFGAMQAGSSTEELVDLMKKFNIEVGEAATKSNDLAKLFEANGVALRNQDGTLRSTKDLFYEITNLIANAKSQQEAAVIAQMAFGKAAGDALPFLQQGAAAIKESEQNARNLGAVISNETIAKADEFDDRWSAAWATWEARAKTAIINAYDFMVQQGKNPNEMLPGGTSGAGAIWNWMTGNQPGITPYGSGTGPGGMFSGNRPAVGGGGRGTVIPPPTGSGGTTTKQTTQEIIDLTNSSADYIAVAQKMSEQVMAVEDAFVGFFTSLVNGTKPIDALRNSLSQLGGSLLKLGLTKGFEILVGALAGGGGFTNSGLGSSIQMGGLYAAGGAIKGNTANIVGENGPELFVPGSSGYVVPNNRLGGSGGGTGSVIINNFTDSQVSARQGPSGKDLVVTVERVMESKFGGMLNRHAPLVGARPVAKRTV